LHRRTETTENPIEQIAIFNNPGRIVIGVERGSHQGLTTDNDAFIAFRCGVPATVIADTVASDLRQQLDDLAGMLEIELSGTQSKEEDGERGLTDVGTVHERTELFVREHEASFAAEGRLEFTKEFGGSLLFSGAGLTEKVAEDIGFHGDPWPFRAKG